MEATGADRAPITRRLVFMSVTLAPGDTAPDFTLPTATGGTLHLGDLRGKRVVLYAYPAAGTPVARSRPAIFATPLAH